MSTRGLPVMERFWLLVEKTPTCWLWKGSLNRDGYARFKVAPGRREGAHRFAYSQLVGPIPDGMTIDHLCRVRNCVNPAHLEAVSHRENLLRSPVAFVAQQARKTHCKRGHELTPENTNVYNGRRQCRKCGIERNRRWRLSRRAADGHPEPTT